jgi:hypothetical protein
VTDACNHTTTLQYDASVGVGMPVLTNITDASGMSSFIQYDSSAPPTLSALITPYGTNSFTVLNSYNTPPAVHVNELGLRDHLYLYVDQDATGQITNSYATNCPTTTGFSNLFDAANSDTRNTFYWGP